MFRRRGSCWVPCDTSVSHGNHNHDSKSANYLVLKAVEYRRVIDLRVGICRHETAIEQIEALRYKLRMMGIPVEGPTNVFCDNESVFKNSTHPESVLKKKHNAIAYHRTREAQAAGICRIAWEDGRTNIADILTKLLPGPRLRELIASILW